jgi:tetratricopeptide (TPR) repeat protein
MLKYFRQQDVTSILGIKLGRLKYWDRIGLVQPSLRENHRIFYDFQDLVCLRTVNALIKKGIPATHLARGVRKITKRIPENKKVLTGIRILSIGRRVVASLGDHLIDGLSGQYLLNLDWGQVEGEIKEKIDNFQSTRDAQEWFLEGVRCNSNSSTHEDAMHAYRQAIRQDPHHIEAHINLGALYYLQRAFNDSKRCFEKALSSNPEHSRALYNLGNVSDELDDLQMAINYYERAATADPAFADAHYNLAAVAEKLGEKEKALKHWSIYLESDTTSLHAEIARKRIVALMGTPSDGN